MNDAKPTCGFNEAKPYQPTGGEPTVRSTGLMGSVEIADLRDRLLSTPIPTVKLLLVSDDWYIVTENGKPTSAISAEVIDALPIAPLERRAGNNA